MMTTLLEIPIVYDTSGNWSKKCNKFDQWCLTLAGLHISEATYFIACSNNLSAMQMTHPSITVLQ